MMKALDVEESILEGLSNDLQDSLRPDPKMESREKAALRIQLMLEGMARKYHIKGEVKMFGSFSNGFKTGSSDMDVVLLTPLVADAVPLLKKFEAEMTPEVGIGNITKIYQASVPLLKLTDMKTGMEVDFCINNELGVRNSQLLHTYCEYDSRVLRLGRLVKDWAKKHELVGTADGCLNSYAYMLLVIYYLQTLEEPVLPNLQEMATESVLVTDMKWGCSDRWETKFWTDVSSLEPSKNTATVAELLIGFFHYYVKEFDWSSHAVCMRLNKSGENVDKFKLNTPTTKDQWYVEDPFDLRHNLAGKCSIAGKARILKKMEESLEFLKQPGGWEKACPSGNLETYLLKLRVSTSVTAHSLLEMFEEFDLTRLYFPKPESNVRMAQAYLEFSSYSSRRRAHTCNERWIADDCQLQLHYSTQHSLSEAIDQGNISTYEMASYKMQRQVFAARMMSQSGGSGATRLGPGNFPENLSMQPGSGAPGGVDPAAAPAFNFMWSGSAQSAGGNPQHPPRQMMQHAGPMVQMGWPNGMPPGPGNGQPGQIPPQPPGNNTARPPGPPPGPPPPEAHMVPSMANFMQMQMQQQQQKHQHQNQQQQQMQMQQHHQQQHQHQQRPPGFLGALGEGGPSPKGFGKGKGMPTGGPPGLPVPPPPAPSHAVGPPPGLRAPLQEGPVCNISFDLKYQKNGEATFLKPEDLVALHDFVAFSSKFNTKFAPPIPEAKGATTVVKIQGGLGGIKASILTKQELQSLRSFQSWYGKKFAPSEAVAANGVDNSR